MPMQAVVKTNKLGYYLLQLQGEGTAADADYSGENLKTFIKQDAATGNTTYRRER